jgi:HPt (histidine-containing phosphotransfer) domain-containing protein
MDGIQATRAIRQSESVLGIHTSIVAMTAHAMQGDREACLDAGMDGYLSKPIQPKELLSAITQFTRQVDGQVSTATTQSSMDSEHQAELSPNIKASDPNSTVDESVPLDLAALLARVEDDWELLDEMISLFLESSPLLLAKIEATIAVHDGPALERAAHALKGAMQSMGAAPAAQAAFRLEERGRAGDLEDANELLISLKHEFDRLIAALEESTKGVRS